MEVTFRSQQDPSTGKICATDVQKAPPGKVVFAVMRQHLFFSNIC